MRSPKPLNSQVQMFTPDGRLTIAGMKAFQDWLYALREAKADLEDHETRITALEP